MPLFDLQSLCKWHCLWLESRRLRGGLLAKAALKLPAGASQLAGHRDYAPGDDYRYVDWNLCARHDELVSRQFPAEAHWPVCFLLDCSASMAVGRPAKFDLARQVVAALAYVALADLEQVTVLGFSDQILSVFPPICGKGKILKLAGFLDGLQAHDRATSLEAAARQFVRQYRRGGLVVVVSDLYDPNGFAGGLDVLRQSGYRLHVVQIYHQEEKDPRLLGDLQLADVESGACWQATVTERHLARYRQLHAQLLEAVRDYCARHRIACAQLPAGRPLEELLLRAMRAETPGKKRQPDRSTKRYSAR